MKQKHGIFALTVLLLITVAVVSPAQAAEGTPVQTSPTAKEESPGKLAEVPPLQANETPGKDEAGLQAKREARARARKEKAEAAMLARQANEKEMAFQQRQREQKCIIKPVMTDAQIALCKEAWH